MSKILVKGVRVARSLAAKAQKKRARAPSARNPAPPVSKTTWGGRRKGAGRRRADPPGVTVVRKAKGTAQCHGRRPMLGKRGSAMITVRVRRHVWNLRSQRCFQVVFQALHALRQLEWIRVVDYSVLGNHLHLIVEVEGQQGDARAVLARGMQSFLIRVARGLNRVMGMSGKVFEGRYDARPIRNAAQARRARIYVVNNARRHFPSWRDVDAVDPYSSGDSFEGWRKPLTRSQVLAARELRRVVSDRIRVALERRGLRVPSRWGALELCVDEPETQRPKDRYLRWAITEEGGPFSLKHAPGPRDIVGAQSG